MLNLQSLPLILAERFVIGHFRNKRAHLGTKLPLEFLKRRLRILNSIVQYRRNEHIHILNSTNPRDRLGHRDWVIDIRTGAGILATLIAMFVGGEMQRAKQ